MVTAAWHAGYKTVSEFKNGGNAKMIKYLSWLGIFAGGVSLFRLMYLAFDIGVAAPLQVLLSYYEAFFHPLADIFRPILLLPAQTLGLSDLPEWWREAFIAYALIGTALLRHALTRPDAVDWYRNPTLAERRAWWERREANVKQPMYQGLQHPLPIPPGSSLPALRREPVSRIALYRYRLRQQPAIVRAFFCLVVMPLLFLPTLVVVTLYYLYRYVDDFAFEPAFSKSQREKDAERKRWWIVLGLGSIAAALWPLFPLYLFMFVVFLPSAHANFRQGFGDHSPNDRQLAIDLIGRIQNEQLAWATKHTARWALEVTRVVVAAAIFLALNAAAEAIKAPS